MIVTVDAAFNGAEVVFHMAAPDSSINNHQLQYSVNVQGRILGHALQITHTYRERERDCIMFLFK